MAEAIGDPHLKDRRVFHHFGSVPGIEGSVGVPLAAFKFAHGGRMAVPESGSHWTRRWREVDSNFRFRDALSSPTARPWSRRLIRREWRLLE